MNKKILFSILLILLAGVVVFPFQVMGVEGKVPTELDQTLANIKAVVQAIGTALVIVGFVVAGIMYLTSAGSTEKMGVARKALFAAIIGATIVILAYTANTMENILRDILGVPRR